MDYNSEIKCLLNILVESPPISRNSMRIIYHPLVIQFVRLKVSSVEAHNWLSRFKEKESATKISIPIPSQTTLRDWMYKARIQLKSESITEGSNLMESDLVINKHEKKTNYSGFDTVTLDSNAPNTLPDIEKSVPQNDNSVSSANNVDVDDFQRRVDERKLAQKLAKEKLLSDY